MPLKDLEQRKEYSRKQYLKNRDKILGQAKRYYQNNKEIKKSYSKIYKKKNPEKVKIWSKIYYEKNKEKTKILRKQWRIKNRNKVRDNKLIYYYRHRDECIRKKKIWEKNNLDKRKLYKEKNAFIIQVRDYTNKHFEKDKSCLICGSSQFLQFHHLEYNIPVQIYDFVILCKPCHLRLHRLMRRQIENGIVA